MDAFTQIALLLINTGLSVYIMLVWLRFLLQLAGADFYNPMSQFVVRATSPVLHPVRRIVPALFGIDFAALVLIYLLKLLQLGAISQLTGQGVAPLELAVTALFLLLLGAASFFFWIILGMVILSWVAMASGGVSPALMPLMQIAELILAPCRRILPDMGGFDLSPIIAFLAIKIFEILVGAAYPQVMAALGL
ncbi:MAG: YggT family protein [Perlucidibaca sp.]